MVLSGQVDRVDLYEGGRDNAGACCRKEIEIGEAAETEKPAGIDSVVVLKSEFHVVEQAKPVARFDSPGGNRRDVAVLQASARLACEGERRLFNRASARFGGSSGGRLIYGLVSLFRNDEARSSRSVEIISIRLDADILVNGRKAAVRQSRVCYRSVVFVVNLHFQTVPKRIPAGQSESGYRLRPGSGRRDCRRIACVHVSRLAETRVIRTGSDADIPRFRRRVIRGRVYRRFESGASSRVVQSSDVSRFDVHRVSEFLLRGVYTNDIQQLVSAAVRHVLKDLRAGDIHVASRCSGRSDIADERRGHG
ncbi:MAG: hypothetical protein BWY28_02621 [bacterium ADurb.Bin236]|nr:MAG: hypothetical protein BWY28_02621 [bacterium ADurb.Bin236]